ncbi:MAG: hypothetical protein WA902_20160, partial [Thermosynechococcaceae cyanobacterium]
PIDSDQIQSKMNQVLEINNPEPDQKSVAIIPNLSWCFLRSAEGLDGIDYLRDCLLGDRTQFWVIGGGQVGWQFLNSILKLKAHCGEVVELPSLSGEQLQDWLMPIIDSLEIHFDQSSIQDRLQELGEERSHSLKTLTAFWEEIRDTAKSLFRTTQKDTHQAKQTEADDELRWSGYFERLSDLSEGVSTIALQLFIKSIRYEEVESVSEQKQSNESDAEETDSPKSASCCLVARMPRLPKLPDLEQDDLYILYSLLVHGDLTLDALSESLGEERQLVNDHVQLLRKTSLIEQKGQVVKVNPIHYPRLKKELAGNNFIVKTAE